jgi:FKBP-type peptidyl-prolyl cis-trans isomerase FklB
MKAQGIEKLSYISLNKGIADALKENANPIMNQEQCNMTIQQKLQEYAAKRNEPQKAEGRKFLAENKKQPGVVELPSGIQYKIITQGNGIKPTLEDTIKVHYKGTTLDGNVFDDSYSRGEPIEFPLGNLIEGWKQALVLMPVGSKWQIFIPSDYAYGDRGAGANIPGGATLVFELELLDVKPAKK